MRGFTSPTQKLFHRPSFLMDGQRRIRTLNLGHDGVQFHGCASQLKSTPQFMILLHHIFHLNSTQNKALQFVALFCGLVKAGIKIE